MVQVLEVDELAHTARVVEVARSKGVLLPKHSDLVELLRLTRQALRNKDGRFALVSVWAWDGGEAWSYVIMRDARPVLSIEPDVVRRLPVERRVPTYVAERCVNRFDEDDVLDLLAVGLIDDVAVQIQRWRT